MIERQTDAFQHINRFSADASHELRTPLTILQLESREIAQGCSRAGAHSPAIADQIGKRLSKRLIVCRTRRKPVGHFTPGKQRGQIEMTRLDLGQWQPRTTDQNETG